MAGYNITPNPVKAYDGERAYVVGNRKGKPYLRTSKPLKAGENCYRMTSYYNPKGQPAFEHTTAFRKREYAWAWGGALIEGGLGKEIELAGKVDV